MRNSKKLYWVLLALAIPAFGIVDYVTLPAYNFQSFGFWILLAAFIAVFAFILGRLLDLERAPALGIGVAALLIVVSVLATASSWLIWPGNSARYYSQLAVDDRDAAAFSRDFPDASSAKAAADTAALASESFILPRTDKQLSIATAQSKLGNYGARFNMNTDIFTSIAVERGGQTEIVRVSPLDYADFMVALTGGSRGTAGYIEVNQVSEEGRLVMVQGGMKYTPGAVFGYDLDRHLRFRYRSALFGAKSFEVDDAGNPFWVVPVLRNAVGLFSGAEAKGLVLVNPVSGEMKYYDRGSEPEWVDRAIPTDIAVTQANNHLRLKNGWINAAIGEKRDVFQLSDSYNYVVSKGSGPAHTWLVSGITSPSESDQTLVGFMAINLKTKEARRYAMSGITEMRAMETAQSDERVRAQSLTATWPILVDLDGQLAYYLFLKNSVQRQRFVYVDLATGQKVAMGDTIDEAKLQFARLVDSRQAGAAEAKTTTGTVLRVKDSPEDKSVLFILAGDSSVLYQAATSLGNSVLFMSPGDHVDIAYRELPSAGRRFVTSLTNRSLGR
jgi:hypothetical protein